MNMTSRRTLRGFSLIEVMIAVVVLSFGLLALAALQGSLFRAGAESKARANATAIAQQVVENAKTFAFMSPPTGYAGNTYASLVSGDLGAHSVGGVEYSVRRQVRRFLANGAGGFCIEASCPATVDVGYSGARAEFKELIVNVSWSGVDGAKSVQLTDSVSSVSPADSAQVIKQPTGASRGPEVWIEPPNKDNPQVVPIGIGSNEQGEDMSAASSNPKPEQFVQDVSAATLFSVQTFTGSTTGDEVRLNRKLDVAAVSCVCQNGTATSSATNPAYQATQWNGKQLAYMEPQAVPAGAPIATPLVSNSSSEIEAMCTVCCRDHHETASRNPRPDPYRPFVGASEHYGYPKQGNSYQVSEPLALVGGATANLYVDACHLIRVNGLMRMAVDAQQNHLLVTPLNDEKNAYRNPDFISDYSEFVSSSIGDGMASLPAGYPSPTARFPKPTDVRLNQYSGIVTPDSIALPAATDTNNTRKLVAFGLYVDYLNADTIKAFNCAKEKDDTGDCIGLGKRNPLEVLPLYAVNVANLGSWESAQAGAGSVVNATYSNQGLLAQDGGTVKSGTSSATEPFLVKLEINNSNSGLAGTSPVDPDDKDDGSLAIDAQAFTKATGIANPSRNSLIIKVGASSTLSLSTVIVTAGGTQCTFAKQTGLTTCRFDSPAPSLSVVFDNYTTSAKVKGVAVISDRKICVPSDSRVAGPTVSNDGAVTETAALSLTNLAAVNYTLTVDIIDQTATCPAGTAPLTP